MFKLSSRKFVIAVLCMLFFIGHFVYMAIMKWLTADKAMQYLNYIPMFMGIYSAANVLDKKEQNNGGINK